MKRSDASAASRRFAYLGFVTAGFTYALIVFGGIVRITESGMGCGEDWPLCNGQLIPEFTFETLIEYGHRLAALLVSILVLAVAVAAFRRRRSPEFERTGAYGWAIASLGLLVVQVLVGAITVRLRLPVSTVVIHLAVASALLGTLLLAGLRAVVPQPSPVGDAGPEDRGPERPGYATWATATAVLGFVVVVFGALVANSGAAPLCTGFPLCNGQIVPEGGGLVHLHWTHRLLAYALVAVIGYAVYRTIRDDAPRPVVLAAGASGALVAAQLAVAAALVLQRLPDDLRGLHLAVGVALWGGLVIWATLARRLPARADRPVVASSRPPGLTAGG